MAPAEEEKLVTGVTIVFTSCAPDLGAAWAREGSVVDAVDPASAPNAADRPDADRPEPVPAPPAGMHGEPGPLLRLVRDQRVAFLIVGGINTVLGTAWFIVFQSLLGASLGRFTYLVSLLCAHVAAVLTAFVLYRRFVFRVRGNLWIDLARFELVNLSALAVNAVSLPFVVEVLGIPPIPSQLLITLVTALISYFGHRDFSFRRPRGTVAGSPEPTDPQENPS
ncbi:GtrA family protein [Cellulomonas wangleii]|uniref:GtrA family protein n=1 Tax=Cellulomonas wangleii TaxID=2816956 RepID=UPI0027DCF3D8|nr:GtrA family protein [Cellulomonas wangleii]